MPQYSRTSDPAVVGVLERGDLFLGTRKYFTKGEWQERSFKYKVLYPAVYFGHSGNWVIRCKGRFKKKTKEEFEVVEHIIMNHLCVHKYKFSIGHIMAARALTTKKIKLKAPPTPLPIPPPPTLTDLLKPKPKKKLSEMKIKLS